MLLRIASVATLIFLALPLLLITLSSFSATSRFSIWPDSLSLRWYRNLSEVPSFADGITFSLYLAFFSSAVGLLVATMASVAIVRFRFAGRQALNALIMAPLVVPEVVLGLALVIWLQGLTWLSSTTTIYYLHCIVVLPFMMRIITASLQRADPTLEEAARVLGATPLQAFAKITFPLMAKGIVAALLFGFVMSFHNFTATFFLVSGEATLPVAIFQYIRTEHDPTIAALSTVLMIGSAIIVWATDRFLGLDRVSKV